MDLSNLAKTFESSTNRVLEVISDREQVGKIGKVVAISAATYLAATVRQNLHPKIAQRSSSYIHFLSIETLRRLFRSSELHTGAILCKVLSYPQSESRQTTRYRVGIAAKEKVRLTMQRLNCAAEKRWKKLYEYHEKYGKVVRLGPNSIMIADKDMLKQVLVKEDFRKAPNYDLLKRR